MTPAVIGFWVSIGLVLYPYVIYPILLAVTARFFSRPIMRGKHGSRSVSFVVSAHNEQANIERRLKNLLELLSSHDSPGEIIVVSDGSTDDTAAIVRLYTKEIVRLIELPTRVGKAEALNRGVAIARNDLLIFADVRQTWAPDALQRLVENFADSRVGAVSGDLVLTSPKGTMSGVGLYWRYEKWLRRNESAISAQIGVTGAISACRRELFSKIPPGTLLDDVYWPLQIAMQGKRVIHDSRAIAYDRLPEKPRDEFRRKVRTLAGNFQLIGLLPLTMIPIVNPVWVQWVSHKLARLLAPWALIGLLFCSLLGEGSFFQIAFLVQIMCYGLGLIGVYTPSGGKLTSACASFVVLNAAAWVAFWVWITGRASRSWGKVSYDKQRSVSAPREERTKPRTMGFGQGTSRSLD